MLNYILLLILSSIILGETITYVGDASVTPTESFIIFQTLQSGDVITYDLVVHPSSIKYGFRWKVSSADDHYIGDCSNTPDVTMYKTRQEGMCTIPAETNTDRTYTLRIMRPQNYWLHIPISITYNISVVRESSDVCRDSNPHPRLPCYDV